MSLSAEYLYTTGRYKFRYRTKNGYDTTAVRQNGDVSALRGELGFFGQLSGGSWRAKAYVYNSERGYPGAIVRGKFSNAARQWDTNVFLQSQLKKSFSDCYSLMLTAKYAYDFVHYLSDTTRNLAEFFSDNHFRQHEIYLSNANRWQPFPWWSIGLSVDFQWNKLDADLDRFVFPQRFLTLAALSTGFDFPHVKLQASVLGTFVSDRTQAETAPPLWKFTPAVFLNYQPSLKVDLKLRAFFKQSMRLPTFNDLYYTLVGNSRLKPENTTQYDIGLSFNQPINAWFSLFSLQIDGYFNQISDKIVAMPTSNFFRWTMLNLGKVEIWGTDVAVQTTFRPVEKMLLDLRATYTFQSATDRSNAKASTWGGQIPYIPRHAASCTFSGSYADWSLTYSFIYTGERYDSSANVAANYIQPWYTHDVALNWQHRWPKFGLKLTAEVNNLLNQQYDVVRNYPMPGTNFRLCAKIQL